MPEMTARQAAVQALMRVNHEGGYSNLVLNETLKKHSFPRPMRHLPASCSTVRWNGG